MKEETADINARPEDPVDVVRAGKAPPQLQSLFSFVMQKPRSDIKVLAERAATDKAAEAQAAADKAAAAQAAATILAKAASYRAGLDTLSKQAGKGAHR